MDETLATEVAEPIDAPLAPSGEEDISLADHEAAYSRAPLGEAEQAKGEAIRERISKRARSNEASPEDVPTIRALTAKVKALEEGSGIARATGESERVYRLRVRAELAERSTRPVNPATRVSSPQAPAVFSQVPAVQATRLKPSEDEIGTRFATYAEFVEDLADWRFEQREATAQQAAQQSALNQQQQEFQVSAQREWQTDHASYGQKLETFIAAHPDFTEKFKAWPSDIPWAAYAALVKHDNGPAIVYHLLQHPDQLAEMLFLLDGKPATDTNVAHATRWLSSRMQAVTTGSATPTPPLKLAPRPPNPVRTGPMKTDDELPSESSSLAEHEKAFGRTRR